MPGDRRDASGRLLGQPVLYWDAVRIVVLFVLPYVYTSNFPGLELGLRYLE